MGNNFDSLLKTLGFGELECKIASFIFLNGSSHPGHISRRTGIKRPTTYSALRNLEEKGLVIKTEQAGKAVYELAPAEQFYELQRSYEDSLFKIKHEALKGIRKCLSESKVKPTVNEIGKVITIEREKVYAVQFSALTSGDFDAIFNPAIVADSEQGKKTMEKFLKETSHSESRIRELVPESEWAKWYIKRIRNKNHQVRLLPANTTIKSDIIVTKSLVFFLHYSSPEQAFQIVHSGVASSLKSWFEHLWKMSR